MPRKSRQSYHTALVLCLRKDNIVANCKMPAWCATEHSSAKERPRPRYMSICSHSIWSDSQPEIMGEGPVAGWPWLSQSLSQRQPTRLWFISSTESTRASWTDFPYISLGVELATTSSTDQYQLGIEVPHTTRIANHSEVLQIYVCRVKIYRIWM